jgi:hypothetical protein
MSGRTLGVVMNGVTGRMGYRQHLVRSVLAINAEGGVTLSDGSRVLLKPVLVGRSELKLRDLAERHDIPDWTTDLSKALAHPGAATKPFRGQWQEVPDNGEFDNGFKIQWELFIRHVLEDAPFPYDFAAGANGVRLAEAGLRSSAEGRRVELAPFEIEGGAL